MDRPLDAKTAVAPQITPDSLPLLKEAGVTAIVCNRPDTEVSPDLAATELRAAAEAIGLSFTDNPLAPGMLSLDVIEAQRDAIDASPGRVLCYCASGTRSAYLWAFAMALEDRMTTPDILAALDNAGYPAPGLGPQLDHVRASHG